MKKWTKPNDRSFNVNTSTFLLQKLKKIRTRKIHGVLKQLSSNSIYAKRKRCNIMLIPNRYTFIEFGLELQTVNSNYDWIQQSIIKGYLVKPCSNCGSVNIYI